MKRYYLSLDRIVRIGNSPAGLRRPFGCYWPELIDGPGEKAELAALTSALSDLGGS
jgi:hypothetical protein